MGADYRDEALPNHVELKALDINKSVRPNGTNLDGYYAYANSTVRVGNAVIDNGTVDITADRIFANGIAVDFGRNGYTKTTDPSTGKMIGTSEIPTGHAVRPEDVENIGRSKYDAPEVDGVVVLDNFFDAKFLRVFY